MTFLTSHSLDGATPCDHSVAFAFATWLDIRYILDSNIIMWYVGGDQLPDDISLLALDCHNFRSYTSAVVT